MPQLPIELKGSSFTLSVVHLHQTQPELIRQALLEKVRQAPDFLKGAPIVLNISSLDSHAINWKALQHAIKSTGLTVVGVCGCNDNQQRQAAIQAGLPIMREGKVKSVSEPKPQPISATHAKTRIINTPIRSGQQIYAKNGDLIVNNHVSAGAELIADGNIHIYGMMRGRALAGAGGDTESQIFCTHFQAELVSIAGRYWLSEQIPAKYINQAVRLNLIDNELTIQSLN